MDADLCTLRSGGSALLPQSDSTFHRFGVTSLRPARALSGAGLHGCAAQRWWDGSGDVNPSAIDGCGRVCPSRSLGVTRSAPAKGTFRIRLGPGTPQHTPCGTSSPGLLQPPEHAQWMIPSRTLQHHGPCGVSRGEPGAPMALFDTNRRFESSSANAHCTGTPPPSTDLLVAQLDRVVSLTAMDNVHIGVLPIDGQAVATPGTTS